MSHIIIKAGAIVGTLDITTALTYSFLKNGGNPLNVLKYMSSAIFGKDAFAGGNEIIVLGLILHYVIAFSFTILFFWLYPKLRLLSINKIVAGVVYGLLVWCVMNLIVVPSSNVLHRPFNLTNSIINALILIVCIGIPLSLMANAFYRKDKFVSRENRTDRA